MFLSLALPLSLSLSLSLSLCLSSSLSEVREESIVQAVGCEDRRGSGRHYARGARLPSSTKEKRINRVSSLLALCFAYSSNFLIFIVKIAQMEPCLSSSSQDQTRRIISGLGKNILKEIDVILTTMCWPASRISNPVVSSKSTSINSAWFDIWALLFCSGIGLQNLQSRYSGKCFPGRMCGLF